MPTPYAVASRIRRSVRPWVAGVATAAALNVELLTGAPPDRPARPSVRIAWVARRSRRPDGLDAREVIEGRVPLLLARDLDPWEPSQTGAAPTIGPN